MEDRKLTGATSTTVSVQGRQLLIDGVPVHLKGVNWNPVDRGDDQSSQGSNAINFAGRVDADSDLMVEAGINVVRTYVALTDTAVLDKLYDKGIYVMNTVLEYYTQTLADVEDRVNLAKDHPAVIMWVVGNEWNYNGLYRSHDCAHDWSCMQDTQQQLRDAAYRIKATDPTRPVSTIYGELPDQSLVDWFGDSIDVWGINVYSGKEFGDRFDRWAALSGKPMYFGEYGADAWNANAGGVDESAQAEATRVLTEDIVDHSAVTGGVCIGGIIFEFNDEWWKAGNAWAQDAGGVAPGGGPWPDFTFNEEYWGLVTIDRVKREAFNAYRDVASPGPGSPAPPAPRPAPAPAPPAPAPAPPAPAPAPPAPSWRWHRRRAAPAPPPPTCGEPSEECQGNLDWAMNTGIYSNPEWYPGLTPESSSDEFQEFLSENPDMKCLPPCP